MNNLKANWRLILLLVFMSVHHLRGEHLANVSIAALVFVSTKLWERKRDV